MKYSFIITYYNRDIVFHNTLLSYEHFYRNRHDIEFIVLEDKKTVKDKREHEKLLFVLEPFFDSLLIRHEEMDFDNLTCPCSTLTYGGNIAEGKFLVLCNPENMLVSDIINGFDVEFEKNEDVYVVPACMRVSGKPQKWLKSFDDYLFKMDGRWIQNRKLKIGRNLNHCTAISKEIFISLKGFGTGDLRLGGADSYFIKRVSRKYKIINRDDLIVLHITHENVLNNLEYQETVKILGGRK